MGKKKREIKRREENQKNTGEKKLNSSLDISKGKQNIRAGGNICHLSLRQRSDDLMQVRWS